MTGRTPEQAAHRCLLDTVSEYAQVAGAWSKDAEVKRAQVGPLETAHPVLLARADQAARGAVWYSEFEAVVRWLADALAARMNGWPLPLPVNGVVQLEQVVELLVGIMRLAPDPHASAEELRALQTQLKFVAEWATAQAEAVTVQVAHRAEAGAEVTQAMTPYVRPYVPGGRYPARPAHATGDHPVVEAAYDSAPTHTAPTDEDDETWAFPDEPAAPASTDRPVDDWRAIQTRTTHG
jgi:hypothetical protein